MFLYDKQAYRNNFNKTGNSCVYKKKETKMHLSNNNFNNRRVFTKQENVGNDLSKKNSTKMSQTDNNSSINSRTELEKVNGVYTNGTKNGSLYLDFWDNSLRVDSIYWKTIFLFVWISGLSFLYYNHITAPIMAWAPRPWCDFTGPDMVYIDIYHLMIIDYVTFWSIVLILFFNLWFALYVFGGSYVFLVIQNLVRTNSSHFFEAYDFVKLIIQLGLEIIMRATMYFGVAINNFVNYLLINVETNHFVNSLLTYIETFLNTVNSWEITNIFLSLITKSCIGFWVGFYYLFEALHYLFEVFLSNIITLGQEFYPIFLMLLSNAIDLINFLGLSNFFQMLSNSLEQDLMKIFYLINSCDPGNNFPYLLVCLIVLEVLYLLSTSEKKEKKEKKKK